MLSLSLSPPVCVCVYEMHTLSLSLCVRVCMYSCVCVLKCMPMCVCIDVHVYVCSASLYVLFISVHKRICAVHNVRRKVLLLSYCSNVRIKCGIGDKNLKNLHHNRKRRELILLVHFSQVLKKPDCSRRKGRELMLSCLSKTGLPMVGVHTEPRSKRVLYLISSRNSYLVQHCHVAQDRTRVAMVTLLVCFQRRDVIVCPCVVPGAELGSVRGGHYL